MTTTKIREFVMTPAIEWLESSSNLQNFSTSAHRPIMEIIDDHDCESSCSCGCGDDGDGRCFWDQRDESNMLWVHRDSEENALDYFLNPEDIRYDNQHYQEFVEHVESSSDLWHWIGK